MPSLTRKLIQGHPYYYVRHCQRVNGRPKIVKTTYLGTVEHILRLVEQTQTPEEPAHARVFSLGDVAALYDVARQLDLVGLLDAHLPKRDQGLSIGQYLLLAALNRALCPTSKAHLASWYHQTILPRLLPATTEQLSSQAFWNHLDHVTPEHIEAIERELSARLVERYQLNLRTLVYDGTNFFTYMNTRNPATLPARGHNKQKRGDLRQVSLGMLVSTDFHIPLFHQVYTGNLTDATVFKTITQELCQRYAELARGCEHVTLIFDKGNNSAEAMELLADSRFHFVGSLVPTQHPELLAIDRRRFTPLKGQRLEGVLAYRTTQKVFGQSRTVVVTYNDNLWEGQLQGIQANLEKTRRKLGQLQRLLRRRREGRVKGGKAPTVVSVRRQVEKILSAQFMKKLLHCEVQPGKVPSLTYHIHTSGFSHLLHTQLGKTLLFTDNDTWTNEEIVLAYRSQSQIESAFRDMKNPHFLGWSPMHCWTDSKIRVHAFYCVLALTLVGLLQRTLHQQGIDLSMVRLLETLGRIQEVLVLYAGRPGEKKPRAATCLSEMDEEQKRLFDLLQLNRYRASR